jgi:hypothetical protein
MRSDKRLDRLDKIDNNLERLLRNLSSENLTSRLSL